MRFCELEKDLQKVMQKANYKKSEEVRNIVNESLRIADNTDEFRTELTDRIDALTEYLELLLSDICKKPKEEIPNRPVD